MAASTDLTVLAMVTPLLQPGLMKESGALTGEWVWRHQG